MMHPVLVVGVGGEGLASLPLAVQERIEQADQLWGSRRLLACWPEHPAEKIIIDATIAQRAEMLPHRGDKRVVVLASGDPGFYGIAATLLRYLPPEELEIVPHVNALQLAFARISVSWSDAVFTSAHARPLAEMVGWAKHTRKLGILTDSQHTPGLIAQTLLDTGLSDCRAVVAENLGLAEERITDARLSALPEMEFIPLNVLLLIQDADWQPAVAFTPRPAEAYAHRRGLITKADVRALSLARLALRETDTIWDIGAGSGSMSIEMAELAWRGEVYAVEHDAENLEFIRQNKRLFGALNVTVVEGYAPGKLVELPLPDAVFIGGTGGRMSDILAHIATAARPGCRIVMALATLENLTQAMEIMKSLNWSPQVTQVNLSDGVPIAGMTRFAPLNPVFIVSGVINR
jgi:precorrin-6B C5,15-methyltransferase / cobalt-precorrin-6B C5,C15-methyltransferase